MDRNRDAVRMADIVPMFQLNEVSRVYTGAGPDVHALKPTDLTIASGSYTAVMGASGSGKSTLLNLLGLLDQPTTGQLIIDGIETATLTAAQRSHLRAATIGFVFQAFHLLQGRTVMENVELGLVYLGVPRRRRRHTALEVLDRVGLAHRLDTDARLLSGGEQQRVAIARAIASGAKVLLCDEPTGNLDRGTGAAVLALLQELHRGGTTIVAVTHDAAVAAESETLLTVADGVVSTATPLGAATPSGTATVAAPETERVERAAWS
jgi:putative ABC transport system ATP-binding protein